MKIYALIIVTAFALPCLSQSLKVDRRNPVTKNFVYFKQNNELRIKTLFNKLESSLDTIEINSVNYVCTVEWNDGHKEQLSGRLDQTAITEFEADIQDLRGRALSRNAEPGRIWASASIAVSYKLNNELHTLPIYTIKGPSTQITNTKIKVDSSAVVMQDLSQATIKVSVQGNIPVKLTSYTIVGPSIAGSHLTISQPIDPKDIRGSAVSYAITLKDVNIKQGSYNVTVFGETLSSPKTPISSSRIVMFLDQIRITSIEKNINGGKGYEFNLKDTLENKYVILTTGSGKLDVVTSSFNNISTIKQTAAGRHELTVISKKLVFDEDDKLTFEADGTPLPGKFSVFRPYPDLTISLEQKDMFIAFKVLYPEWITIPDIKLKIPGRKELYDLIDIEISPNPKYKLVSKDIPKKDFHNGVDSVINGMVEVLLQKKKIITAQFKFVNLQYYKTKLTVAQTIVKKDERKDAVTKVVASLFMETGGSTNSPLIGEIIKNLSSNTREDKDRGWNNILSFLTKLAPALIAFI